MAKHN
jgi:hypothetical protein